MDYKTFTDDQLDEARTAILIEQERRANMARIPAQVTELAKTYRAGGGGEDALMDAIRTPAP